MIANLEQVIDYTRRLGEAVPSLRKEIVIESPGCDDETITQLRKAFPGMPESYLCVLRDAKIDGIAIGYFQLLPFLSGARGAVETLRFLNDPRRNRIAGEYRGAGVYQVAAWEADPICVAYAPAHFRLGQVVKYNSGNPMAQPEAIADDFEQLLALAATLDSVRGKYKGQRKPIEAQQEFLDAIKEGFPQLGDQEVRAWESMGKVVLG